MCETRNNNIVTQLVFINTIDSNSFYNSTNELRGYRTLHMYQTYTTLQSMCSYLFVDVSNSLDFRQPKTGIDPKQAFLVPIPSGKMADA